MSAHDRVEADILFTPPPLKKARRRSALDSLRSNSRDEKYAEPSQTKGYYASTQRSPREETAVPFFKRALYAAKMSWAPGEVDNEIVKVDEFVRHHFIFSATPWSSSFAS